MNEIRRRKGNHHRKDKGGRSGEGGKLGDAGKLSPKPSQNYMTYVVKDAFSWSTWDIINAIIGLSIATAVSVRYALYAKELHENEMWFSNIGQVEREISFRTESGLYFSYYKQMVLAPSISEGFYQLTHDNKTEHLLTINILHRFNVYQEVILGVLYRILPLKDSMEYVYFYINSVFGLHGMFVFSIFLGSWIMSGSWCSGLLGASLFIFNRSDSTRVSFTIPLRESFSLPFIFAQLAVITVYFKEPISNRVKNISLVLIYVTTFFLVLTWQFAQFVLLLEGFALFGTWSLELVSGRKVRHVLFAIAGSLLAVSVLQFLNDMLLASLALSFSLSAITVMLIQDDFEIAPGFFRKLLRVFTLVTGVLTMCIAMNLVIKWGLKVDSDEHVFKFLLSKFGFAQNLKKDFDALLYLCEGAFQMMPFDTFSRLTVGVVFPIYVIAAVAVALLLLVHIYQRSSSQSGESSVWLLQQHPEIGFHLVLTVMFGTMGMTTLRMKFLWVPHMCLFASGAFCQSKVWRWLLWKIEVKELLGKIISHLVPLCLLGTLLWNRLQPTLQELNDLREFYDPDTVELMNWIKTSTPPDAGFSGSMQLMAGVKLCTDRPITNHPHYENKFLRQRTKEVYQMYARRRPHDVAQILKKHGADYIILENSICYSRQGRGCRLIDLLDLDNGDALEKDAGTSGAKQIPRFCHAVKANSKTFQRYFQKVFENRTFYVYKVKS